MPKVSHEYRAERRAHILAAARRCFVRDGFHGTSMQDLVDEAGVSSGAVYRYFPSKDAVIETIAAENLDQVVNVIRASIGSGVLSVGKKGPSHRQAREIAHSLILLSRVL